MINIPALFTRDSEACFGLIEVYPQDADGIDLTQDESFDKYTPAIRAACYHSPEMYKTLREIVSMAKAGSSAKEISGYAKEMIEKVEESYSSYKENKL